jgi:cytochrome c oxidase cbb3-type subunit III
VASDKDVDEYSGRETTGHEWDGIKELNNPLPRWWLWTFYATVIWGLGYVIAMPAIPLIGGYTEGVLGYSSRKALVEEMKSVADSRAGLRTQIAEADLAAVRADPDFLQFAISGGRSAFAVNCIQCHGSGAAGFVGYPNLNDDDWVWGGSLDQIHDTIRYGIRSEHDDTRANDMPAFLDDEMLTADEINDVAENVLARMGSDHDSAAAARGADAFAEQCAMCHGENGEGIHEMGAPRLNDALTLYGADKQTLVETISHSRGGVMPAWEGRLDPVTLKQLAVFVHSLGGGE